MVTWTYHAVQMIVWWKLKHNAAVKHIKLRFVIFPSCLPRIATCRFSSATRSFDNCADNFQWSHLFLQSAQGVSALEHQVKGENEKRPHNFKVRPANSSSAKSWGRLGTDAVREVGVLASSVMMMYQEKLLMHVWDVSCDLLCCLSFCLSLHCCKFWQMPRHICMMMCLSWARLSQGEN